MHLYRKSYKDRQGEKQHTRNWYVEFSDHRRHARHMAGFKDKGASQEMGRRLERLAEFRQAGRLLDGELRGWVEGLNDAKRALLLKWGMLDEQGISHMVTLADHLKDFEAAMRAKKRRPRHITWTISQIQSVLDACQFRQWGDVSAHKIELHLESLALKHRSTNGYIVALKTFGNWAQRNGRVSASPFATLEKLKVTDATERRAFSPEEFRLLQAAANSGGRAFGLNGRARMMVYTLAVHTGLRATEIQSLRVKWLELSGERPMLFLPAEMNKNGKVARLPLPRSFAGELLAFTRGLNRDALLFDMPDETHAAEMLKYDLAAARKAWLESVEAGEARERATASDFLADVDAQGRVLVFHSLRHTRGVWLFQYHRASPREVQELMRLRSISQVDRYSRSFHVIDAGIADRGPVITVPS